VAVVVGALSLAAGAIGGVEVAPLDVVVAALSFAGAVTMTVRVVWN
jgi:hypothetical protein